MFFSNYFFGGLNRRGCKKVQFGAVICDRFFVLTESIQTQEKTINLRAGRCTLWGGETSASEGKLTEFCFHSCGAGRSFRSGQRCL